MAGLNRMSCGEKTGRISHRRFARLAFDGTNAGPDGSSRTAPSGAFANWN
ncbi:MAG: hypothetical protein OJF48_001146 [Afipia sp.]|nr:MAG: hypothetical protein OJF48_001146 [Afipia sp.]